MRKFVVFLCGKSNYKAKLRGHLDPKKSIKKKAFEEDNSDSNSLDEESSTVAYRVQKL